MLEPPATTDTQLLERIRAAEPHAALRFSLFEGRGCVRGSEKQVRLCCDLWNLRGRVAAALRLVAALRSSPEHYARLTVASCTCGTKSPDTQYHADSCVYAAAMEAARC